MVQKLHWLPRGPGSLWDGKTTVACTSAWRGLRGERTRREDHRGANIIGKIATVRVCMTSPFRGRISGEAASIKLPITPVAHASACWRARPRDPELFPNCVAAMASPARIVYALAPVSDEDESFTPQAP